MVVGALTATEFMATELITCDHSYELRTAFLRNPVGAMPGKINRNLLNIIDIN